MTKFFFYFTDPQRTRKAQLLQNRSTLLLTRSKTETVDRKMCENSIQQMFHVIKLIENNFTEITQTSFDVRGQKSLLQSFYKNHRSPACFISPFLSLRMIDQLLSLFGSQ